MKRRISRVLLSSGTIVLILGMLLSSVSFAATPAAPPSSAGARYTATLTCTDDSDGANDEPGQKDLTRMCLDDAGAPTSLAVSWNWDEINWPGGNTGDGCSLYDTDSPRDGLANYALCVTVGGRPAIQLATTLYSCGNTRRDRCSQPVNVISPFGSLCSVTQEDTDPFLTGDEYPTDTVASCTVPLSDAPGATGLLDVCSYPSGRPNSDPSDCVVFPVPTGQLEVVKDLVPDTDLGEFNLLIEGTEFATDVGDGGTTGPQTVSVGFHNVSETAGTGTSLADYNTTYACTIDNAPGLAGSGTTFDVEVGEGEVVVCTFTNTLIPPPGSITIIKDVVPDDSSLWDFTLSGPTPGSKDDLGDGESHTFTELTAGGTYTVTEDTQAGYNTSVSCDNESSGANSVSFDLGEGEAVVCTFTNTLIPLERTLTLDPESATNHLPGDKSHTFTATVMEDSTPVQDEWVSFETNFGGFGSVGGPKYTEVKTNSNGEASVTVYSDTPGTATIRAWLDDGDNQYQEGEITDTPSTKTWLEAPPVCELDSVTLTNDGPKTVPNTIINFTASVVGSAHGSLKYEWDFDGNGTVDSTTIDDNTESHDYGGAGSWTAKVIVTDQGIADCAVSDTSEVTINEAPPVCELASVTLTNDGPAIYPDTTIEFTASVVGTAHGNLKYEWDFDGNGTIDKVTIDDNVESHDYGGAGSWTAKVIVTDLGIADCAVSDTSSVSVTALALSADGVARCGYWEAEFYSNVTAEYYVRVKLDGHTVFKEGGTFIGDKYFYDYWDLWGEGISITRITYWVKVGAQEVGEDEKVTRNCGTPAPTPTPTPPPAPTPTPLPTPTPFVEVLGVERLPVTGAVTPSSSSDAWRLSAMGLLLIASGGTLRWLKKRE